MLKQQSHIVAPIPDELRTRALYTVGELRERGKADKEAIDKLFNLIVDMTEEGLDIVGIGTSPSRGLRKGVVINIESTVNAIRKALQEAELMAGCEIKSVFAGIAGGHIKGINSQGVIAIKNREVTNEDVRRVIDAAKALAIPMDREVIHILPQEFIPVAEQTSLMPDIDRWVIRHALQRLAEEHAKNKQTNFFIKLSGYSLNDPGLLPWLSEQIKEYRVSGDTVVFELDDTSAFMHRNETKAFIAGMKQLHCKIVLEHFGRSPNSIKNLKHLDVDFLKIDGEMINSLASDSQYQDSVKSIIQTAHSMGKLTIAEFVQDANSLALLWQFGVNYIEGNFLQEPSTELEYDFTSDS